MKPLPPFHPPYPTNALEPFLGEAAVRLHFGLTKAYVTRANLEIRSQAAGKSFDRKALKFSTAGAKLHKLWWENLKPYTPGPQRASHAKRRVTGAFGGTMAALKRSLLAGGMGVQGSGWVALAWDKARDYALVVSFQNHNFPWNHYEPLLLLDVWEHSYICEYGGDRKAYLKDLLKLVDWAVVASRLP